MKFNKKIEEKDKISYEQLYAGALLKFDNIDNVDLSLLVKDFEEKTNKNISGLWEIVKNIGKYSKCAKNGTISLRDEYTLDYFIEEEGCTLREKLIKVCGDVVKNYFDNIDIENYKQTKEELLKESKDKTINNANILLISDIQEDYDALIEYGFKNIDYFKSIVRADEYFAKHPEQLEKYHIILKGNQNVQRCCLDGDVPLDRKIREQRDKKNIFEPSLNSYKYRDHTEYVSYLCDNYNRRSWDAHELSYSALFDRLIENILINNTLEKIDIKTQKFMEYVDYENPNKLPLPSKKSDLKILYLDSIRISQYAERIAQELGLNITFKEDDNCGLGRHIKTNLGNYDIIIASKLYSSNLLWMNCESTEQCKDTGRQLTLLATYDDHNIWGIDKDLGDKLELGYSYGGNLAPNAKIYDKEFRVLRQLIDVEGKEEYWVKYDQSDYTDMKAILESSVSLYNDVLKQKNNIGLIDIDFKSVDDFENEYVLADEEKTKKREAELAPIRAFDNIRYSVLSYLNNVRKGFINEIPQGLRITEGEDGIEVENIYEGRTLCTIVFPKEYKKDNLRIFDIQTISKKGNLSNPQTIGLYTSEYKNLENLPNRPDEKQSNALASIEKKVKVSLIPLNVKAWNRELELDEQKRLVLERKKKNNKK